MNRLEIHVYVGADDALASATTECGSLIVIPTAEQLAALTSEQRGELAQHVAPSGGNASRTLNVSACRWEAVVAALDRKLADAAQKKNEARLAHDGRVATALAMPRAEWIVLSNLTAQPDGDWYRTPCLHLDYQLESTKTDPRVATELAPLLAAAQAQVDAAMAARETHLDADRAVAEARKRIEQERKAATAHEYREYVRSHPGLPSNLARATAEGRDVENYLSDLWIDSCVASAAQIHTRFPEPKCVYNVTPRTDVPSASAYELHNALDSASRENTSLRDEWPGMTISVGEISRADVHPRNGHTCLRTVVALTFKLEQWGWSYDEWFSSEPIPDFDEQSED